MSEPKRVSPGEFALTMINMGHSILGEMGNSTQGVVTMVASDALAAAQVRSSLGIASALLDIASAIREKPAGISANALEYIVREATKVFEPKDTDPFIVYTECHSGRDKAHLAHRWNDGVAIRYCEGKTPAQLAEQEGRS